MNDLIDFDNNEQNEAQIRRGKTFGLLGMLISIFAILMLLYAVIESLENRNEEALFFPLPFAVIGLTLSIIGSVISGKASVSNGLAKAGIIIGMAALGKTIGVMIAEFG